MNERTFQASSAHKLDDPERLRWMPPDEVVSSIGIVSGETIADIGAGTGYFALPFARAASPAGTVWAVDLQLEMLELLQQKLNRDSTGLDVELMQGTAASTSLPIASCTVAFLGNVWHELDERETVLEEMQRILRPGGRLAILDWRTDVLFPPGPPSEHRIGASHTEAILVHGGWREVHSSQIGLYSYMVIARPPGTAPRTK